VKLINHFTGAVCMAGSLAFSTAPVLANACAPHDDFSKHLAMNYQEKIGGVGVANDGSLFEIFVSDKGTWSLLITNGKKISCIAAAGEMWVPYPALGAEARLR
jgi:hypothetical protein